MSRRRNLEDHRASLVEIRNIMNSMKTLAYMETRKLARYLDAQRAVVRNIEAAATDLLSFQPHLLPPAAETKPVCIVLGTERGFCGDFNHALRGHLATAFPDQPAAAPLLVAVGRKLHPLLERDARVAALLSGASVIEEIVPLLASLLHELITLQPQRALLTLYCLYHGGEEGVVMRKLLPPFQLLAPGPPDLPHPPLLNLPPREFLGSLTDHYLFAVLHEILFTSLMAENQRRLTHLEGAVRHLDEETAGLTRRCNVLRQEEIVEEIEVLLLSTAAMTP